jgi:hypothetical protein
MSSAVPGLGLLLVVGLAGMVSRKRLCGGDEDSNTVWRVSGSTADVSQESKPTSVERDWRSCEAGRSREAGRWVDRRLDRRLRDNKWVLDVMGRMAFEREDRAEAVVSTAERSPLDPGGVGESKEALPRSLAEVGVVSW